LDTSSHGEAAVRQREERFRQMADTIPEVIWITSVEPERVLYTSPSFERIWGLKVQELYSNPRRCPLFSACSASPKSFGIRLHKSRETEDRYHFLTAGA